MADAICGPSNPLQNFQKHTAVDRSLQHDRLTSRPGYQQGFRSQLDTNAGLLDPEFEAFEAGAPLGLPEAHPTFQTYGQDAHHPLQRQSNQLPQPHQAPLPFVGQPSLQPQRVSWASDFQQRHLQPSSISRSAQHHRVARPIQRGWHEEFQSSHQPTASPYQQQHASAFNSLSSLSMQRPVGFMPSQDAYDQSSEARWKGKGKWQADPAIDSAAFEQEFEALDVQEKFHEPSQSMHEDNLQGSYDDIVHPLNDALHPAQPQQDDHFSGNNMMIDDEWLSKQSPLPDTETTHIPAPEPELQIARPPETDEQMRATARQVIDHVQHETSDKFKKSEFFALMRQIRDGEKEVKQDKIITVNPAALDADVQPQWNISVDADLGRDGIERGALDDIGLHENLENRRGERLKEKEAAMAQETYMRPGGHPVDDFLFDGLF